MGCKHHFMLALMYTFWGIFFKFQYFYLILPNWLSVQIVGRTEITKKRGVQEFTR